MQHTITKYKNFTIQNYPIIDSTNEQAKRLASEGLVDDLVIVADSQTMGRGRNGRDWVSDEGNLFFSIVIDSKKIPAQQLSNYVFVAATAVSDAVEKLGVKTQIKWPNDILIEGKKLCGILLEKHKDNLIIGIGININSYPEHLDRNRVACRLNDYAKADKQTLLNNILSAFEVNRDILNKQGFDKLSEKVLNKLYKLNEEVEFDTGNNKIVGIIRWLNSNGALILETKSGLLEYNVGEIFAI